MKNRLRGMSLLAAGALLAGGIAGAPAAMAAQPADAQKLCSPGYKPTDPCRITVSGTSTITEGAQIAADVQGTPNTTVKVRPFSVQTGKLVPVGAAVSVTTDNLGFGKATMTVDKLQAPLVGGYKEFTIQTADSEGLAADSADLIKPNGSTFPSTRFTVNSGRAAVTSMSQPPYATGSAQFFILDFGIPGDDYDFEYQVGGKWTQFPGDPAMPQPGIIGSTNKGTLRWTVPDLAKGEYPVRIINKRNGEVIWTNTLLMGVDKPGQPGKPGPAPTTKPTTKPTKPAPKQPVRKPLAKTGL